MSNSFKQKLDHPEMCSSQQNLKSIEEIPSRYREVFSSYGFFNTVQSAVLEHLLYTDSSIVISAPTGSGKTGIFELAIIKTLMCYENTDFSQLFKIVYICPMKALCEERVVDWHRKFSSFQLNCISVTGDSDNIEFHHLLNHNLIITTPEKWDSLTRKWKDNKKLVNVVKLFMIDEVHLLNEGSRGSTLETIVCRMKTIQKAINHHSDLVDDSKHNIRFIAASATIPNIEDIADWFGTPENVKCFRFSEETRPVKLRKIVLGYHFSTPLTPFKFDLALNYKLQSLLLQYSDGKPTLIFCSTRKIVELTAKHIVQNLTINLRPEQKQRLFEAAQAVTDVKIRNMLENGVGYHHAGLLLENRHTVENLFRESWLPILVTTSTLAMGVNLPAHLVIVKSTKTYQNGEFRDYSETAISQMIGRAGRPQFDTSATALILTNMKDKAKFERMIGGCEAIESNLHRHLTEHLNAEVVLHTITDLDVALQWLSSTFLYIRARKNPKYYGFPVGLTSEQIDKRLLDMCQIDLNKLVKAGMLTIDHDMVLTPTNTGCLMARYYLAFETMKLFTQIKGDEIMQQIIGLISKCQEFSEMYLRVNDKRCLNLLNKCKDRQTIRFPLTGRIKTLDMKINCIIQAVLGCLDICDHSILSETFRIIRNAERIAKCLIEYLTPRKNCFSALLNSILIAKCFHAQLWEDSPYVSKQLVGIGTVLSRQLGNSGKSSFQAISESDPRGLEYIINKRPPTGDNLLEQVIHLPRYRLKLDKLDELSFKVEVTLENADTLAKKSTVDCKSVMYLLVGDSDNNILVFEKYSHTYMMEEREVVRLVEVADENCSVETNFISADWVGIDCNAKWDNPNKDRQQVKPKVKAKEKKGNKTEKDTRDPYSIYMEKFMEIYKKECVANKQTAEIEELHEDGNFNPTTNQEATSNQKSTSSQEKLIQKKDHNSTQLDIDQNTPKSADTSSNQKIKVHSIYTFNSKPKAMQIEETAAPEADINENKSGTQDLDDFISIEMIESLINDPEPSDNCEVLLQETELDDVADGRETRPRSKGEIEDEKSKHYHDIWGNIVIENLTLDKLQKEEDYNGGIISPNANRDIEESNAEISSEKESSEKSDKFSEQSKPTIIDETERKHNYINDKTTLAAEAYSKIWGDSGVGEDLGTKKSLSVSFDTKGNSVSKPCQPESFHKGRNEMLQDQEKVKFTDFSRNSSSLIGPQNDNLLNENETNMGKNSGKTITPITPIKSSKSLGYNKITEGKLQTNPIIIINEANKEHNDTDDINTIAAKAYSNIWGNLGACNESSIAEGTSLQYDNDTTKSCNKAKHEQLQNRERTARSDSPSMSSSLIDLHDNLLLEKNETDTYEKNEKAVIPGMPLISLMCNKMNPDKFQRESGTKITNADNSSGSPFWPGDHCSDPHKQGNKIRRSDQKCIRGVSKESLESNGFGKRGNNDNLQWRIVEAIEPRNPAAGNHDVSQHPSSLLKSIEGYNRSNDKKTSTCKTSSIHTPPDIKSSNASKMVKRDNSTEIPAECKSESCKTIEIPGQTQFEDWLRTQNAELAKKMQQSNYGNNKVEVHALVHEHEKHVTRAMGREVNTNWIHNEVSKLVQQTNRESMTMDKNHKERVREQISKMKGAADTHKYQPSPDKDSSNLDLQKYKYTPRKRVSNKDEKRYNNDESSCELNDDMSSSLVEVLNYGKRSKLEQNKESEKRPTKVSWRSPLLVQTPPKKFSPKLKCSPKQYGFGSTQGTKSLSLSSESVPRGSPRRKIPKHKPLFSGKLSSGQIMPLSDNAYKDSEHASFDEQNDSYSLICSRVNDTRDKNVCSKLSDIVDPSFLEVNTKAKQQRIIEEQCSKAQHKIKSQSTSSAGEYYNQILSLEKPGPMERETKNVNDSLQNTGENVNSDITNCTRRNNSSPLESFEQFSARLQDSQSDNGNYRGSVCGLEALQDPFFPIENSPNNECNTDPNLLDQHFNKPCTIITSKPGSSSLSTKATDDSGFAINMIRTAPQENMIPNRSSQNLDASYEVFSERDPFIAESSYSNIRNRYQKGKVLPRFENDCRCAPHERYPSRGRSCCSSSNFENNQPNTFPQRTDPNDSHMQMFNYPRSQVMHGNSFHTNFTNEIVGDEMSLVGSAADTMMLGTDCSNFDRRQRFPYSFNANECLDHQCSRRKQIFHPYRTNRLVGIPSRVRRRPVANEDRFRTVEFSYRPTGCYQNIIPPRPNYEYMSQLSASCRHPASFPHSHGYSRETCGHSHDHFIYSQNEPQVPTYENSATKNFLIKKFFKSMDEGPEEEEEEDWQDSFSYTEPS